jgi:hypothetical protein
MAQLAAQLIRQTRSAIRTAPVRSALLAGAVWHTGAGLVVRNTDLFPQGFANATLGSRTQGFRTPLPAVILQLADPVPIVPITPDLSLLAFVADHVHVRVRHFVGNQHVPIGNGYVRRNLTFLVCGVHTVPNLNVSRCHSRAGAAAQRQDDSEKP